jgi:quercetin dioxygenase-like cupin family protein
MNSYNIDDLPYVEFGGRLKRKVRIVVSPYTNGENNVAVVHVTVPPAGVSDGHIHEECDEMIHFDNNGTFVLDGEEFSVKKNSMAIAPKGKMHECRNTSEEEVLNLLCIFVPAFKPYGRYPELIEMTRQHFEK